MRIWPLPGQLSVRINSLDLIERQEYGCSNPNLQKARPMAAV